MRIKIFHNRQLQVISLSVLYLLISLAVVFFLPRAGRRLFLHQNNLHKSAQVCTGHFKNFLRRTDKISSSGRKQFLATGKDIELIYAGAGAGHRSGVPSSAFLSGLKLRGAQQNHPGYLLHCCWRI